jgi:arylsulfatase A-like enzyme
MTSLCLRKILVVGLMAAGLALPACDDDPPPGEVREPPNVLVIVTDDQRVDTMKVMPATRAWLGDGGIRYTNAYVTTPRCCPARASIMSGRYVHNNGVLTNKMGDLLDQETTIQRYLQAAGYRTGYFGKFLNHWSVKDEPPHFDDWAMTVQSDRYINAEFNVRGEVLTIPAYNTDYLSRRAKLFLTESEERDRTPWFLYLNWMAPHDPPLPEPKYEDSPVPPFRPPPSTAEDDPSVDATGLSDKPDYVQAWKRTSLEAIENNRANHMRTLMSVDERLAELRSLLTRLEERDTLVIFLSDNGLMWNEHYLRKKALPYTEALRVPMFVRWPGRAAAGSVDDRFVTNIDVAATIMAAVGLQPKGNTPLDGRDLLDEGWTRDRVLAESWPQRDYEAPMWATIITSGEHYTEYYADDGVTVEFREYYDMQADPWQLVNLLGDADTTNDPTANKVAGLSAQLKRDRACKGDSCP